MDSLQVSIACLLVKMTFVPGAAVPCPTCPPGYFMVKNCTRTEGIQCRDCTNCSALHQDTLSECMPWTDAVCGNLIITTTTVTATTAGPPVSCDEMWIILSVISASMFLILVLPVVLVLLSRRYKQNRGLYLP